MGKQRRRNAPTPSIKHLQTKSGGVAALGSPYGRAGERSASLRGRTQLQIWEQCEDCRRVPSQSRLRRASSPKGRAKGRLRRPGNSAAAPLQRHEITGIKNEKRSAAWILSLQQTFLFVLIVSSAGVLFVFGFLLGLLGGDDGLLGLHGGGGGDGAQAAVVAEPAVVGFGNEHQANFRI